MAESNTTSYGHEHRFGGFQQKSEFQQTLFKDPNDPNTPLFKKVDYIITVCGSCGYGQKIKVVEVNNEEQ